MIPERELIKKLTVALYEVLHNTWPAAHTVSREGYHAMRRRAARVAEIGKIYSEQPGRDPETIRFIKGIAALTTAYNSAIVIFFKALASPITLWPVLGLAMFFPAACIFWAEWWLRGIRNFIEMRQKIKGDRDTYYQFLEDVKQGNLDEKTLRLEAREFLKRANEFVPIRDGEILD